MCFSASVSFSASAVLAAIGLVSVSSATSPASRLFAATPLLFAAQQFGEGLVWITIPDVRAGMPHQLSVYFFLIVALIVWPVWLPFSLEHTELSIPHRRMLRALRHFGIGVAIVSAGILVSNRPDAHILGHSLHYDFGGTHGPIVSTMMLVAYLISTLIPLFVSTANYARQIGVMLVVSVIAAFYVQRQDLTSVWCFFSALLSGSILFAVRHASSATLRQVPLAVPVEEW
ncbi:MAG: DUF6629 family protein [Gemmatimonadaceae bacterium]